MTFALPTISLDSYAEIPWDRENIPVENVKEAVLKGKRLSLPEARYFRHYVLFSVLAILFLYFSYSPVPHRRPRWR
jgi:hypothetical protein